MDYVRQKAKLMARMKMSGGNEPSVKIQVNGERNLGRLHASLLSAGDKVDSEAGEEDHEECQGERQDRPRPVPVLREGCKTQGMWTS